MRTSRQKKLTKIILSILALTIIAAGSYVAYSYLTETPREGMGDSTGSEEVNLSPATKDDTKHTAQIKQEIVNKGNDRIDSETQDNRKQEVNVVVTAWGQPNGLSGDFTLNGYASGVIEKDGECTLTMAKGSEKVSVSKDALQNAQNTSCGQLSVPFSQLSTGKWQAILSYSSASATGSSNSIEVEVK